MHLLHTVLVKHAFWLLLVHAPVTAARAPVMHTSYAECSCCRDRCAVTTEQLKKIQHHHAADTLLLL
jgi:hypothetical protein